MSLRINIRHLTCTSSLRFFSAQSFSHQNHDDRRQNRSQAPPQQDPYSLLKEDPVQVISNLWVRTFSDQTLTSKKPITNLTGFLSKLDLWVLAYQRTCAHFTGSFPSRNAIHNSVLSALLSLRNAVVKGNFIWNKKIDAYIRSPNEQPITDSISRRKLLSILNSETPPFQDHVVQEVLLMILEPVFEPRFSPKSHAFRPGRNAHSVIRTIRSNFAGYLWFIRGDISEILDKVDIDMMMGFVGNSVKDKKVLSLIRSALVSESRYPLQRGDDDKKKKVFNKKKKIKGSPRKKFLNPNEPKPDPYWLRTFFDFAPEEASKIPNYGYCGILSPLLLNVCLGELDYLMEKKIVEFFKPCKLDSIWKDSIDDGCHNPSWPEFVPSSGTEKTRKMDYIRYGGHLLIGIRGPREDAVEIRRELIEFCDTNFNLEIDNSKIEIEHITRGIQFLDHIICRRVIYPTLRYTATGGGIVNQKVVGTLLSITASLQQCIRQFRRLKFVKGDKDPEPLPCTPMLYSSQSHTNSQMNRFLETMADWYRYADNRKKVVGFCAYVIRSSLAKLYAARYRLKSRAKVYKIASRNLSHPLRKSSNNSAPEYSELLRMGVVDAIEGVQFSRVSTIPSCDYAPFARNWVPDHERILNEYIRLQNPKYFCELLKRVKRGEGLKLVQDELGEIVWDYKTIGAQQTNYERENRNDSEKVMLKP